MENLKIIEEKENKLFNRKEIRASTEADITPTKSDVEKMISKKFSTQPENIKIKKISGSFGSNNFIISANIYDSKEDKESIEGKSKEEKITEAERGSDDRELINKENSKAEAEVNAETKEQLSQTESSLDNSSNKSEPIGEANQ